MKRVPYQSKRRPIRAQRGLALILSLLLLVVLSIIGVSVMQSTLMEERMAGNTKDRAIAFQAAEAALRDAEACIRADPDGKFNPLWEEFIPALGSCSGGICRSAPGTPKWPSLISDDNAWTNATLQFGAKTAVGSLTGVASQPRYLIEYQGCQPPGAGLDQSPGAQVDVSYLITASATGASAQTRVFLQSLVEHRTACFPRN